MTLEENLPFQSLPSIILILYSLCYCNIDYQSFIAYKIGLRFWIIIIFFFKVEIIWGFKFSR